MSEITDAEAAEVLWAGSEQGKAAIDAAWKELLHLRRGRAIVLNMADVEAIVRAAYLAAGWDTEPMEDEAAPAHDHHWAILGVQPHTPFVMLGKPTPHTIVLIRCAGCGTPEARLLPGEWTLEDLQEGSA